MYKAIGKHNRLTFKPKKKNNIFKNQLSAQYTFTIIYVKK